MMKTRQFIKEYLKDEARITLADENGNIYYNGDVMSLQNNMHVGRWLVRIDGLGNEKDIVLITTNQK